jgi:hypothetical protein
VTIINHTYHFVFVHIPKNAGTSVALALAPLNTYRDQELGGTELGQAIDPYFRRRYGIGKHSTLREIGSAMGPSELAGYRSFCVARDPLDRVASMFRFLRRWPEWKVMPQFRDQVREFEACRTLDAFVASAFFATPGPDRLFLSQTSWITGASGEPIGVDRVVPIERLREGVREFLEDVGVSPSHADLEFPVANRSAQRGSDIRLSHGSRRALEERYADDFEHLGYRGAA